MKKTLILTPKKKPTLVLKKKPKPAGAKFPIYVKGKSKKTTA